MGAQSKGDLCVWVQERGCWPVFYCRTPGCVQAYEIAEQAAKNDRYLHVTITNSPDLDPDHYPATIIRAIKS